MPGAVTEERKLFRDNYNLTLNPNETGMDGREQRSVWRHKCREGHGCPRATILLCVSPNNFVNDWHKYRLQNIKYLCLEYC